MPALVSLVPRPSRALVALALAGTVLLAGCGGGGDEDKDSRPAASATTATADTLVATGVEQLAAKDVDGARRSFQAAVALEPEHARAHYNLGYLAQTQDRDDATAIEEYQQAIAADPELAPALYNLALLTEPADLEASVDLYRRVLEVAPEDAPTYLRLGYALRHLGHEAEAKKALARGIELDPALKDVPPPSYGG